MCGVCVCMCVCVCLCVCVCVPLLNTASLMQGTINLKLPSCTSEPTSTYVYTLADARLRYCSTERIRSHTSHRKTAQQIQRNADRGERDTHRHRGVCERRRAVTSPRGVPTTGRRGRGGLRGGMGQSALRALLVLCLHPC